MDMTNGKNRWLRTYGVVLILVLAAAYGTRLFFTSQGKIREELEVKRTQLAKVERVASEAGRYQQRVEALRAALQQGEKFMFVGVKLPVAAAEIQDILHKLGQESSITIVRENVRPPKKGENLLDVTVELSIQGDIRDVRNFLYKIQTAPKLLVVPKVVIRGLPVRGPTGVAAELLVAGYLLNPEEKGAASPQSTSSNAGAQPRPENG